MTHATDMELLEAAESAWGMMGSFRRHRRRCKRYCYGDQWSDTVEVDGLSMTEEEYIRSQGNLPLKNNLIRRLVRNVVGVYRSQGSEPQCVARDRGEQRHAETLSTLLQYNGQLNRLKELHARSLEEFLISGLVVHKKWHGRRGGRVDCWTHCVDPEAFFMNREIRDCRGWDISLIGEIRHLESAELEARFARGDERRREWLRRIYGIAANDKRAKCRVIEVWHRHVAERYRCFDPAKGRLFRIAAAEKWRIDRENGRRGHEERISAEWFCDDEWRYSFLSPGGHILEEGGSPYGHGSHPYVVRAYPLVDGEVHSFVADVIDQQRYTNRLISMYDWIMRASAKGVLLVPEQVVGTTKPEEFARAWSRFNGVIYYTPKPGVPLPQQISANSTNIGIGELLQLQLRFFEDISGVNSALQGNVAYSGTSGSLFSMQTHNATVALLDLLETFSQFVIDGAYKDVKNIRQYYGSGRIEAITGSREGLEALRDLEFDVGICEGNASPAYRMMAN